MPRAPAMIHLRRALLDWARIDTGEVSDFSGIRAGAGD
jgi:hypothetical protein